MRGKFPWHGPNLDQEYVVTDIRCIRGRWRWSCWYARTPDEEDVFGHYTASGSSRHGDKARDRMRLTALRMRDAIVELQATHRKERAW